tara:strand:+ start:182 stop:487 length:306 start_codon:yes stop_codon:yes gene_type:complete
LKKIILILFFTFLIFVTSFVKNSTKKLNDQIYATNESISVLKNKLDLLQLEYNYLTSPDKLVEYQKSFFDEELIPIELNEISKFNATTGEILNDNKLKFND